MNGLATHTAAALAAAALAGWAAWQWQGDRAAAAIDRLQAQHATAAQQQTQANARHLLRVWERGDQLAAALATQQAQTQQARHDHEKAIDRLTTGRPCLSAELVGLLNQPQPAAPAGGPDPMPPPASDPAAAPAASFATDADVSTWAATARQQYAACAAQLNALIEWHGR